jgi:hypothetical protein
MNTFGIAALAVECTNVQMLDGSVKRFPGTARNINGVVGNGRVARADWARLAASQIPHCPDQDHQVLRQQLSPCLPYDSMLFVTFYAYRPIVVVDHRRLRRQNAVR